MIDTEFDDEWLNRAIAAREARRTVLKAPRRYYHATTKKSAVAILRDGVKDSEGTYTDMRDRPC
jgi:hypothetical protein